MRSFSVLALSSLAAIASAAPAPQVGTGVNDPNYSWQVTEWEAGCARAGCYYQFNITGTEYTASKPTLPAFFASCSGATEGAPFTRCSMLDDGPANRGVAARLLKPAEEGTGAHIEVSFQFGDLNQADTYYNYTGNATASYNQFVSPPYAFTITPSSAFGIA